MSIDLIDYSREAFDAAKADYARNEFNSFWIAGNAYRKVQDLLAAAHLEAHHEATYRLRGTVELNDSLPF